MLRNLKGYAHLTPKYPFLAMPWNVFPSISSFLMHNDCFLLHFTVGKDCILIKPAVRSPFPVSNQSLPFTLFMHSPLFSPLVCCPKLIKPLFPQLHWICFGKSCHWPLDKPGFMNISDFWAFNHSVLLPKMFFLDKSLLSLNTQWKGHLYI